MEEAPARKLAVLLHADVVSSTALVRLDETIAHHRIRDAFTHFSEFISSYGGVVHELRGDALVAEFSKASDAIAASIDFQAASATRNEALADEIQPVVRIGIAMGEVLVADNTVTGEGVVLAQRLEQLAGPGGVCIQGAAYETVPKRLPVSFEYLGERELKGFPEPVRAYAVKAGVAADAASLSGPTLMEPSAKPSIAVLPFTNMSGDPAQEYFSDGITEDIITELCRFHSLSIIARTSTFQFKNEPATAQAVARELGVNYIVLGSVRKAGERARITVELVDASTGVQDWAERYDRQLGDVFAVQEEIARTVAGAITPEVGRGEQERARRKPPRSLSAWELYHRGLWHLYRFSSEELAQAQKLLENAISLDPEFAAAHSSLAYTLVQKSIYDDARDSAKNLAAAVDLAEKSLDLDDKDAMGYFVLGRAHVRGGDYDEGRAELERAIELNPSFAYSYLGLGEALFHLLEFEGSLANLRTAFQLSPRDPHAWAFVSNQAWPLIGLRRYEEAIAVSRQALRSPRAGFYVNLALLSAMGHLGQRKEARAEVERLNRKEPGLTCEKVLQLLTVSGWFRDAILDGIRKAGLPD